MAYRTTTLESVDDIAAVYQAAPGTEVLYDGGYHHGSIARHLNALQHVKSGDGRVLLVPQPSRTDENDPLRWSSFKKWITLLNGIWFAFNGSVTGPIMAAGKPKDVDTDSG